MAPFLAHHARRCQQGEGTRKKRLLTHNYYLVRGAVLVAEGLTLALSVAQQRGHLHLHIALARLLLFRRVGQRFSPANTGDDEQREHHRARHRQQHLQSRARGEVQRAPLAVEEQVKAHRSGCPGATERESTDRCRTAY